jgi:hypothetical protein
LTSLPINFYRYWRTWYGVQSQEFFDMRVRDRPEGIRLEYASCRVVVVG